MSFALIFPDAVDKTLAATGYNYWRTRAVNIKVLSIVTRREQPVSKSRPDKDLRKNAV